MFLLKAWPIPDSLLTKDALKLRIKPFSCGFLKDNFILTASYLALTDFCIFSATLFICVSNCAILSSILLVAINLLFPMVWVLMAEFLSESILSLILVNALKCSCKITSSWAKTIDCIDSPAFPALIKSNSFNAFLLPCAAANQTDIPNSFNPATCFAIFASKPLSKAKAKEVKATLFFKVFSVAPTFFASSIVFSVTTPLFVIKVCLPKACAIFVGTLCSK